MMQDWQEELEKEQSEEETPLEDDGLLAETAMRSWQAAEAAANGEPSWSYQGWEEVIEPHLDIFSTTACRIKDERLIFDIFLRAENSPLTGREEFYKKSTVYLCWLVREIRDPELLLQIIVNTEKHEHAFWFQSISRAAVFQIVDQSVLEEIAKASNAEVYGGYAAEAAVRSIQNRETLALVAKNHPDFSVRLAAAARIDDQEVLADLVCADKHDLVRKRLTEQITDQDVLTDFAVHHEDPEVRKAAVKKITDRSVLASIAVYDSEPEVRIAAVDGIKNQKIFKSIATGDEDPGVRERAMCRIKSNRTVEKIVLAEKEARVRRFFLDRITNRKTLLQIVRNDEDYYNRLLAALYYYKLKLPRGYVNETVEEAERKLAKVDGDPLLMRDLAANSKVPAVIVDVLDRLPDNEPNREALLARAMRTALESLRERYEKEYTYGVCIRNRDVRDFVEPCKRAFIMMKKEEFKNHQRLLADLALQGTGGLRKLRILAVERLTDPELVKEVFETSEVNTIRRIALNHIYDIGYLKYFVGREPHPSVKKRVAVLERI